MLNTSGCAFFHFVEQNDGIGVPAHRFGELAAFLIAHIPRRRADQAGHGELFHVLRHVDANHVLLVVEQRLREGFCKLRFADAGRAEKQERTDRPVRVLNSGARAQDGFRNLFYGFVLPDHALVEDVLQVQELLPLTFHQARNRNSRPFAHNFCNFFFGDTVVKQRIGGLRLFGDFFFGFQLLFEFGQSAVFQFGGFVQVVDALRLFNFGVHLLELRAQLAHFADGVLFVFPFCFPLFQLGSLVGELFLDFFQMFLRQRIGVFFQGGFLDLVLHDLA
jgi:hypothetical protein